MAFLLLKLFAEWILVWVFDRGQHYVYVEITSDGQISIMYYRNIKNLEAIILNNLDNIYFNLGAKH
jgi:hypothetical protein